MSSQKTTNNAVPSSKSNYELLYDIKLNDAFVVDKSEPSQRTPKFSKRLSLEEVFSNEDELDVPCELDYAFLFQYFEFTTIEDQKIFVIKDQIRQLFFKKHQQFFGVLEEKTIPAADWWTYTSQAMIRQNKKNPLTQKRIFEFQASPRLNQTYVFENETNFKYMQHIIDFIYKEKAQKNEEVKNIVVLAFQQLLVTICMIFKEAGFEFVKLWQLLKVENNVPDKNTKMKDLCDKLAEKNVFRCNAKGRNTNFERFGKMIESGNLENEDLRNCWIESILQNLELSFHWIFRHRKNDTFNLLAIDQKLSKPSINNDVKLGQSFKKWFTSEIETLFYDPPDCVKSDKFFGLGYTMLMLFDHTMLDEKHFKAKFEVEIKKYRLNDEKTRIDTLIYFLDDVKKCPDLVTLSAVMVFVEAYNSVMDVYAEIWKKLFSIKIGEMDDSMKPVFQKVLEDRFIYDDECRDMVLFIKKQRTALYCKNQYKKMKKIYLDFLCKKIINMKYSV